jgi:hypothetical protein
MESNIIYFLILVSVIIAIFIINYYVKNTTKQVETLEEYRCEDLSQMKSDATKVLDNLNKEVKSFATKYVSWAEITQAVGSGPVRDYAVEKIINYYPITKAPSDLDAAIAEAKIKVYQANDIQVIVNTLESIFGTVEKSEENGSGWLTYAGGFIHKPIPGTEVFTRITETMGYNTAYNEKPLPTTKDSDGNKTSNEIQIVADGVDLANKLKKLITECTPPGSKISPIKEYSKDDQIGDRPSLGKIILNTSGGFTSGR